MMISVVLAALVSASGGNAGQAQIPTIIVDTRFSGCSTEEQVYYFPGKAERRAEKVKAVLRAGNVAFREVRWDDDKHVPDAAGVKALAPMKYFRNC